jgi:hypothetical protein
MDYEVQHFTRHCAATGRELAPGESYYSALVVQGAEVERVDYALDAWQGPPPGAIGWWRSQRPDEHTRSPYWAPNDVLLDFFDRLEGQPESQDMRYVLALLLVRRRVMRFEESEVDDQGREVLVAYCPRRETSYRIPAVLPDEARTAQIQEQLTKLLQ